MTDNAERVAVPGYRISIYNDPEGTAFQQHEDTCAEHECLLNRLIDWADAEVNIPDGSMVFEDDEVGPRLLRWEAVPEVTECYGAGPSDVCLIRKALQHNDGGEA